MAASRNVRRRITNALGLSKATFDAWDKVIPYIDTLPMRGLIGSIGSYIEKGVTPGYVARFEAASYHGIYDHECIEAYHAAGVPIGYVIAGRNSEARAHKFVVDEIVRYHDAGIPAHHAFGHPFDTAEFFLLLDEGVPAGYIATLGSAGHDFDSIRENWAAGIAIEYATV